MSLIRCVVALAALFAVSGCAAAIGVGLPPLRVTQTVGVGVGELRPSRARHLPNASGEHVYATRVGINPLQAFPSLFARRVDFGVGWQLELTGVPGYSPYWKNGPFLDLSLHLWNIPLSPSSVLRTSLGSHMDLLLMQDLGWRSGFGTGASITFEFVSFMHGSGEGAASNDASAVASGAGALGEFGLGLSFGLDYRAIDGEEYAVIWGGLSVRLPAFYAFVAAVDASPEAMASTLDAASRTRGDDERAPRERVEVVTRPRRPQQSVEVRAHPDPAIEVREPDADVEVRERPDDQ